MGDRECCGSDKELVTEQLGVSSAYVWMLRPEAPGYSMSSFGRPKLDYPLLTMALETAPAVHCQRRSHAVQECVVDLRGISIRSRNLQIRQLL